MTALTAYDTNWDQWNESSELFSDSEEPSIVDYWGAWFVTFTVLVWGLGLIAGFRTSLVILVIVGLSSALIGLAKPIVGLLGITTICTVDAIMRTYLMTGGLLRWNTLNYELLLAMLIALPCIWKFRDYQAWWLRAFLILLTIELYMSPSLLSGINHLLNIVVVIGLQVYFFRAAEDKSAFLWVGLLSGTTAAAGGMVYFLQRDGLARIDENAFSYFPLTGIFGICLAMPVAVEYRRYMKTLIALAMVCTCWLLLIGSRGGLLVGSICLLYLLLNIPGQSRKLTIAVASAIVVLGITAQFESMRERTLGRISQLFDTERSAASRTSGRSDLMLGAWWIFCDNPQGVGTGGFPKHWARISEERANQLSGYKRGEEQTCHSGWMKTLSENGVPGFVLLLGYVGSFAVTGWRRRFSGLFLIGLLTTICLSLAFISTEFAGKGLWLLAAGTTMLLDDRTIIQDDFELE